MARKPEEWEDEDDEEEEDEDPEELVKEYKKSIKKLMKEREQYGSLSEQYMVLTQRIGDEQENLRIAEAALNDRTQRDVAEHTKNAVYWQAAGNLFGNLGGQLISSFMNRKNVKTVVGVENDGEIVNSKAMKFVK